MNAGIKSPRIRKATKRRLAKEKLEKENKLKNKTDEEIEVIITHEVALEDSHPRQEKPKYFGEVIEEDGSIHHYDDATLEGIRPYQKFREILESKKIVLVSEVKKGEKVYVSRFRNL